MRISDWSSDVCSSDLLGEDHARRAAPLGRGAETHAHGRLKRESPAPARTARRLDVDAPNKSWHDGVGNDINYLPSSPGPRVRASRGPRTRFTAGRSEERRVGTECVSTCRSRWAPVN